MRALLLSGGIESAALAFWKRPDLVLTVDYGQRAGAGELKAAAAIAAVLDIEHIVVTTDAYLSAPPKPGRGTQWWPYRNQLLITLAAIHLNDRDPSELQIGLVRDDVYKDCTPAFMQSVTGLMLLQEGRLLVTAPAMQMSTDELLISSGIPFDLLGATISCHFAEVPCAVCAGCTKNRKALETYRRATESPEASP